MKDFSSQGKGLIRVGNLSLCYALSTDVGRRRNENQDCAGYYFKEDSALFIVADGMGGVSGGALASSLALASIEHHLNQCEGSITSEQLDTALDLANSAVYVFGKQNRQLAGMGTTLVGLLFSNNRCSFISVGDSRIFKFSEDKFTQLTRDQTLVQDLIDAGAMRKDEAEKNSISHVLTQSIGPTAAITSRTQLVDSENRRGDRYLLCSDGLYNHVPNEEIATFLAVPGFDPETICQKLQALALERGGADNISILVVDVIDLLAESEVVKSVQFSTTRAVEDSDFAGKTLVQYLDSAVAERIKFEHLEEGPFSSAKLLLSEERPVGGPPAIRREKSHSLISQAVTAFGIIVLGLLSAILLVTKGPFGNEETTFKSVGVIDARFRDMVRADIRAREEAERIPLSQLVEAKSILEDPKIAKELSRASDFTVYTGPDLTSYVSPLADTEPINWEKERLNFTSKASLQETEGTIFSDAEKLDLSLKKAFVRQLIDDIDLRLRLLGKNERSFAQEMLTAVEEMLVVNGEVLESVEVERGRAESLQQAYQQIDVRLYELGAMKVVDEVASVSKAVKEVKDSYFDAVETFLSIHEQTPHSEEEQRKNHDHSLALSGLIKERRVELEAVVRKEVAAGLTESTKHLRELRFAVSLLENRRKILHNQLAILKTFSVIASKTRLAAERKDLLAKRREAIDNFLPVEEKFPNDMELQFRRDHVELF